MAWALLQRRRHSPLTALELKQPILGYCALLLGAFTLTLTALPAWAATGAPGAPGAPAATAPASLFAAPVAHAAMPGQAGSLVRVTVALLVVLAAVFAAAWFSRRMHGVRRSRSSALEVIAQLPLGPRERAVLLRVGAQQVLLGVASGNVRALHVLPPGAAPLPGAGEAGGNEATNAP